MKYILTKPAKEDLAEAAEYYESVAPGGGLRFLNRYEEAAEQVMAFPRMFAKYYGRTRLCQIQRSDYGIVYLTVKDWIYVLGVICLIRRPGYWKQRLRDSSPSLRTNNE